MWDRDRKNNDSKKTHNLSPTKKFVVLVGHLLGFAIIIYIAYYWYWSIFQVYAIVNCIVFKPLYIIFTEIIPILSDENISNILGIVSGSWKTILIIIKIICLLIGIAYFTIAERKIMAAVQRRKGPNVVGFWGLLQPLADGLKLLLKEMLIPTKANTFIFIFAPIMILTLSLITWSIIPFGIHNLEQKYWIFFNDYQLVSLSNKFLLDYKNYICCPAKDGVKEFKLAVEPYYQRYTIFYNILCATPIANMKSGLLFLLGISSLNVYGIIIAGWASNSKYAFLGSLRSAAQMISYEVSIGLVILPVILLAGSLNLYEIVNMQKITCWFVFPLFPCAIIFFISMLAETNRAPFDLPEAEAELVAGYNVEYSSIIFAMFFLGEYSNMLLMSTTITILFFGGWLPGFSIFSCLPATFIFAIKIMIFCFLFILVRAAFPRYRYDQLMNIGWKYFLPITTAYLILLGGVLVYTNSSIWTEGLLQA